MPFPTPPSRRVPSAAETVAKRSGLTVLIVSRLGLILWTVARTVESAVLGVRSGWLTEDAAGTNWGKACTTAARVISELAAGRNEPVLTVADAVGERLRGLGLPVDLSYPPAAGVVATERQSPRDLMHCFADWRLPQTPRSDTAPLGQGTAGYWISEVVCRFTPG